MYTGSVQTSYPAILKATVAATLVAVLLTLTEVVLLFSTYDWIAKHSLAEDFPQGEQLLMDSVRDNIIAIIVLHCLVALALGAGAVLLASRRAAGRLLTISGAIVLAVVSGCSSAGLGIMSLAASHHEEFSGPAGTFTFAALLSLAASTAAVVTLILSALPAVGRHMRRGSGDDSPTVQDGQSADGNSFMP